jgi:fructokinase
VSGPLLTVIGEALIDLVPNGTSGEYRAHPGGSPFNVAIALARLGNRTALMARLSDHGFGRLLRDTATAEGVDLSAAVLAA